MQNTRKYKIIASIIALCVAAGLIIAIAISVGLKVSTDTVVGQINGMDIYAGEIKLSMNSNKAQVIDYYESEKNASIDKDFWDKNIDGETPSDYLRNLALKDVARYKLELGLGIEYGLIEDASYSAFVNEVSSVNAQNQNKIQNGEPIYGQKEYNLNTYYEYRLSNLQLKLQYAMGNKGEPLYADENTLKAYFEEQKDKYYNNVDNYELVVLRIDLSNAAEYDKAESEMNNVRKLLIDEKNYSSAQQKIKQKYDNITFTNMSIDESNYSQLSKQNIDFYEIATELKKGDVSKPFSNMGSMTLVVCKDRTPSGYADYNEIHSALISQYRADKYEQYVDELVKKYNATTNDKFKRISVKDELDK